MALLEVGARFGSVSEGRGGESSWEGPDQRHTLGISWNIKRQVRCDSFSHSISI